MTRRRSVLTVLAALIVLALLIHINVGSYEWYAPWKVLAEVLRGPMKEPTTANSVIWQIRLPRALECACVGGILGFVGSAFQAQLRNPLAEPYVVGVSSGAAIGGALAMIFGFDAWLGGLGGAGFGFVTGLISLAIVYGLAKRRGVVDVTTLLLAGVVVGALMSALLSLCLLLAGQDTNHVLAWLLGSMDTASFSKDIVLFVALVLGSIVLLKQTRRLNAFAMGEDTAARMGVDVGRLRLVVLATGTAMTAAAVGAAGIIGFLGLVAPHIARRLLGVDWRFSLLGSGMTGAILMIASDLIAERMGSIFSAVTGGVPVGIITAILGAPSLLILLRKSSR